jgi:hypothetical protein
MATGAAIGSDVVTAINALSSSARADPLQCWQAICSVFVTYGLSGTVPPNFDAQSQENTATAFGPVTPGPYATASGYPTYTYTASTTRVFRIEVDISYIPTNAADTGRFCITVDGSQINTNAFQQGSYTWVAGQLGTILRIRFGITVTLTAGAHVIGIAWGTLASGFLSTTTACYVNYMVWG